MIGCTSWKPKGWCLVSDALALSPSLSASEIKAQVQLIQQVMHAVMKDGVHYGTIPGTNKPTLYKAGSEKILSTFRIAIEPDVLDLSTFDEARYRVTARAVSQSSGIALGSGVGECSSSEEKYRWRAAVCEQEFDETPEDRRRMVWKKGNRETPPYQIKQVRTNPADVANTVLKMAKKRAQIDATLTVTAASDVFAQDLEDLPAEIRAEVAGDEAPAKPVLQPPQRKSEPAPVAAAPAAVASPVAPPASHPGHAAKISDAQSKRMFAIGRGAGWSTEDYRGFLKATFGVDRDTELVRTDYERACRLLQEGVHA